MQFWNHLNIKPQEILIENPNTLLEKFLSDQKEISDKFSYNIFELETSKVFNSTYYDLINSFGLKPFFYSIGFIVKPKTIGNIHCDFYTTANNYTVLNKHGEEFANNLFSGDPDKFFKTSFHIPLSPYGSLQWFDNTFGKSRAKHSNTGPWIHDFENFKEDQLNIIDELSGDKISICKTDQPHRSVHDENHDGNCRVILTTRFEGNPDFEIVKDKLKNFVIER